MKYVTFCQYKNNINIYETLGTLFPHSDKTFFLLNSYFGQLSISKVDDDFDFSNLTEESINFFNIKIHSIEELKEFVNNESELYGKKYTKSELETIINNRKTYIKNSIQNELLYQNIAFTKVSNPLKYSVINPDGRSDELTMLNVYPDIRSSTAYYSDIAKGGNFDVFNSSLTAISESNYDNNPFQGLFKNLNEKLKTDALLNSDVTRNVAMGKSTVPALTHNTKNDEIATDGIATPFGKVTKPSTNYKRLFNEL